MNNAIVSYVYKEFRTIRLCPHFLSDFSLNTSPNRPRDPPTLVYPNDLRYLVLSGIFTFASTPYLNSVVYLPLFPTHIYTDHSDIVGQIACSTRVWWIHWPDTFIFEWTLYCGIIWDLQKSCQAPAESSCTPFIQSPLTFGSYRTTIHVSTLRNEHWSNAVNYTPGLIWFYYFTTMVLVGWGWGSLFVCSSMVQDASQNTTLHLVWVFFFNISSREEFWKE